MTEVSTEMAYERRQKFKQESDLLVDLHHERPVLWNAAHPEYKSNLKKEAAWREISVALRKTVKETKKEWKNLRSQFDRAIKSEKAMRSGDGGGDIKAKWWLTDKMRYLADPVFVRPSISNVPSTSSTQNDVILEEIEAEATESEAVDEEEQEQEEATEECNEGGVAQLSSACATFRSSVSGSAAFSCRKANSSVAGPNKFAPRPAKAAKKRSRSEISEVVQQVDSLVERLIEVSKPAPGAPASQYTRFCDFIASKLESMPRWEADLRVASIFDVVQRDLRTLPNFQPRPQPAPASNIASYETYEEVNGTNL